MGKKTSICLIWVATHFLDSVCCSRACSSYTGQQRSDEGKGEYRMGGRGNNKSSKPNMTKEKENIEWEVVETTKALSRTGPMEGTYKPSSSLEDELKALQQKVDINSYDYKRIPRPDEK